MKVALINTVINVWINYLVDEFSSLDQWKIEVQSILTYVKSWKKKFLGRVKKYIETIDEKTNKDIWKFYDNPTN